MLQRTVRALSWVRGGEGIGSRHQKHYTLVPTAYLYRFPHRASNPGYLTMKYYWTLGCTPTGLVTPFRLEEFLSEYADAHVPEEVDLWLRAHVTDPVSDLQTALENFSKAINALPNAHHNSSLRQQLPMVTSAMPQLEALSKELGIEVPAICLRSVAGDKHLKARVLDDLYEYNECLNEHGSTPHRRVMRSLMESNREAALGNDLFLPNLGRPQLGGASNSTEAVGEKDAASSPSSSTANSEPTSADEAFTTGLTPTADAAIASALHVEDKVTANDERAIIRLLTTFGEGAMKTKKYDAAASVLESALLFAFDDDCRSTVHNNLATACNRAGEYKAAEHNAREAVLLNHSKKAFANLGVALAYQHREDEALSVMSDALQIHADDEELKTAQQQIMSFAAGKPIARSLSAASVGQAASRYYSNTTRQKAIENGFGNNFGNQFDSVAFNGKSVDAKLNPSEFSQVFRRAHIVGLSYRTSTAAFEKM